MKQSSLTQLHYYFTAIIPFCNKQKGMNLLHSLGYQCDDLDAETCLKATVEYREKFLQPFMKIAKEAVKSPKFEAVMKQAYPDNLSLDKATKDGSMTSKDQVDAAKDFIGIFTNTLDTVLNKGSKDNLAEAERLRAEAEKERAANEGKEQENKSNNTLVLGLGIGGGVLLLVLVLLLIFKKK